MYGRERDADHITRRVPMSFNIQEAKTISPISLQVWKRVPGHLFKAV